MAKTEVSHFELIREELGNYTRHLNSRQESTGLYNGVRPIPLNSRNYIMRTLLYLFTTEIGTRFTSNTVKPVRQSGLKIIESRHVTGVYKHLRRFPRLLF